MAVAMSMPDSYLSKIFFTPILKDEIFLLARPSWTRFLEEMYPNISYHHEWLFHRNLKQKRIFIFLQCVSSTPPTEKMDLQRNLQEILVRRKGKPFIEIDVDADRQEAASLLLAYIKDYEITEIFNRI